MTDVIFTPLPMTDFLLYDGKILPLTDRVIPLSVLLVTSIFTDALSLLYNISCHCLVYFH